MFHKCWYFLNVFWTFSLYCCLIFVKTNSQIRSCSCVVGRYKQVGFILPLVICRHYIFLVFFPHFHMYWTNTKTLWLYTRDGFGDIAVGAPGKHLDGLHVKEFNDGDLMVVMIMMNKMIVRRMIIVAKMIVVRVSMISMIMILLRSNLSKWHWGVWCGLHLPWRGFSNYWSRSASISTVCD